MTELHKLREANGEYSHILLINHGNLAKTPIKPVKKLYQAKIIIDKVNLNC